MAPNDTPTPEELSTEEVKSQNVKDLNSLLNEKAQEKARMQNLPGLRILKKSTFYMNGDELREHIATYKNFAIMLKQEQLKEDIEDNLKEQKVFPALININLLPVMKRVNGNIVRKINPVSLHQYDKMALIQGVIASIDNQEI